MFKRNLRLKLTHLFLPVVVLLTAFVVLPGLGRLPLTNWDEAIYAQISKEILQTGDWLTLHWAHLPWFEKPPLYMWITAVFFKVFGISEFCARLVSALSGIGLITITYLTGKLIDSEWVGLLAALILMTAFQFAQFSRLATSEITMTLFIYSAIYFYLRLKGGNQRWWYLISISCALAFMTKGFASVIAPVSIGLALIFDKRVTVALRSNHFWLSCLLALAIVAPWHVIMYVLHGSVFTNEYILYHVIARTIAPIEGHSENYWYYFGQVMEKFKPWWIFIAPAVALNIKENIKGRRPSWIFLCLSAIVFGFYLAAQTKLSWYMLPLYPALAILVADLLVWISNQNRVFMVMVVLVSALFLLFAVGKIRPLFFQPDPVGTPIKKLALLARRTNPNDLEPLILFSEDGQFDKQATLFYSDRSIQQATTTKQVINPKSSRRYADFRPLAEVTDYSAKRILLKREDLAHLLPDYEINLIAEADPLVYATIKKSGSAPRQVNTNSAVRAK